MLLAVATGPRGAAQSIAWTEDFATDPIAAGRFTVAAGHNPLRFAYDDAADALTVHYETLLPTAWLVRPLDAETNVTLGPCDDFAFTVTFAIREEGFYASPFSAAQLSWGLVNATTTGDDRAGQFGAVPDAFDVVTFDFFPNVTAFDGPSIGPTIIRSDDGGGFFSHIDFTFGAETRIDTDFGDESIALGAVHTATISYDAATRIATLTIADGGPGAPGLAINADGAGGPGGFDADATTIQTIVADGPFAVDAFAFAAWHVIDPFDPASSVVIADIDFFEVHVSAELRPRGDVNGDGLRDGRDVAPFIAALLADEPDACTVAAADFDEDGNVTTADVAGFEEALFGP
jgi:hypothetical protein